VSQQILKINIHQGIGYASPTSAIILETKTWFQSMHPKIAADVRQSVDVTAVKHISLLCVLCATTFKQSRTFL